MSPHESWIRRASPGSRSGPAATGKPLAGSTVNRYPSTAGSIFKYACRMKLVPRTCISPSRGIERAPNEPIPIGIGPVARAGLS
jgi:hypothetical protein